MTGDRRAAGRRRLPRRAGRVRRDPQRQPQRHAGDDAGRRRVAGRPAGLRRRPGRGDRRASRWCAASGSARPGAPTVLVYGHYDVQPTGDLAEWTTPPFELVVDGDVVRGRGVTDDKGPVLLVLEMARALLAAATARCR